MARHVSHGIHQTLCPIADHMGFGGRFKQGPKIKGIVAVAIVMVQCDVGAKFCARQLHQIRRRFCMTRAVNQLELMTALRLQAPHHGQNGRNAFFIGDKHMVKLRVNDHPGLSWGS